MICFKPSDGFPSFTVVHKTTPTPSTGLIPCHTPHAHLAPATLALALLASTSGPLHMLTFLLEHSPAQPGTLLLSFRSCPNVLFPVRSLWTTLLKMTVPQHHTFPFLYSRALSPGVTSFTFISFSGLELLLQGIVCFPNPRARVWGITGGPQMLHRLPLGGGRGETCCPSFTRTDTVVV